MTATERWPDAFLDAQRQQGDPLADEVVKLIVEQSGPEEAGRLFNLLITKLETPVGELPPIVGDFLSATNRLPDWTNKEEIPIAHGFFLDHGPKFLLALYLKSLPLLYTDAKGAEVLVRTSRLTNRDESLRIFARRIAETGQFLIEVMTPGALEEGGIGIQSLQKVRLIHASNRFFLRLGEWDEEQLGLLGLGFRYGCLGSLAPQLLRNLFNLGERIEDHFDGPIEEALDKLSGILIRRMLDVFNQYKGRKFHIPPSMVRAWNIEVP